MFGRKKKREEQLGTAFDRLFNYNYLNDKSNDEQFLELADILIAHRPVVRMRQHILPLAWYYCRYY